MGGIIGRLFREFAVTLAASIGVSAVLSLDADADDVRAPARARAEAEHERGAHLPLVRARVRGRDRLLRPRPHAGCCDTSGRRSSSRSRTVGAHGRCSPCVVPKGFFPQQDTGLLVGVTEAAPDVSFPQMMELQRALADVVLAGSGRRRASRRSSASDGTNPTTNSGRLSITLKPRAERDVERRRDHRAPAAEARGGRRDRALPAVRAGSADRQPRRAARSTSTRSRTPTRPSSPSGRRSSSTSCARARAQRRRERSAERRPPGVADDRSRHRVAPRRSRRSRSTTRSTTPSGSDRSRSSSRS